jgi:pilus assembly protein Flp/PilA
MKTGQKEMFKSSRQAMLISFRRFVRDQRGATSIEYAIIASGVSIVIVGVIATLGSNVKSLYSGLATALK